MTTLTISALVTDRLPKTEADLSTKKDIDWSSAKERAIAVAKVDLYGAEKAEGDIGDQRILVHIADRAALALCGFAIDYFMNAARLSDHKEGATLSYYNRTDELRRKRDDLARRVMRDAPLVMELIEHEEHATDSVGNRRTATIGISTLHVGRRGARHVVTPDPWDRAARR